MNDQEMTAPKSSKSKRLDILASTAEKLLHQESAHAAHQTPVDCSRFELSSERWDAFQHALDQPVSPKPKLRRLLDKPALLG